MDCCDGDFGGRVLLVLGARDVSGRLLDRVVPSAQPRSCLVMCEFLDPDDYEEALRGGLESLATSELERWLRLMRDESKPRGNSGAAGPQKREPKESRGGSVETSDALEPGGNG